MRKVIIGLFIAVMATLILGISLIGVMVYNGGDLDFQVEIPEGGITEETLEFPLGALNPGDSKDYEIKLTAEEAGKYTVTLSFEGESNALTNNLVVEVECPDVHKESTLSALLSGGKISFDCNIDGEVKIVVRYVLPVETGNEVQGVKADFRAFLSARLV